MALFNPSRHAVTVIAAATLTFGFVVAGLMWFDGDGWRWEAFSAGALCGLAIAMMDWVERTEKRLEALERERDVRRVG